MICDICNRAIELPASLLGTKEVVTSKDCWKLYLAGLIADKVLRPEKLQESLSSLVGQLACSDTPWALCATCTTSLKKTGLSLRLSQNDLPAHGHALCRSTKLMEFVIMDEKGMAEAFKAAATAATELLSVER